jgi:hypothetical protein
MLFCALPLETSANIKTLAHNSNDLVSGVVPSTTEQISLPCTQWYSKIYDNLQYSAQT